MSILLSLQEVILLGSVGDSAVLPVIQNDNVAGIAILSKPSINVDPLDPNLPLLVKKMQQTVLDPDKTGVGIAAVQIGVNRNVFIAQRFDKEGKPYEFFINPEIFWYSDVLRKGEEGCLSIPETAGLVCRSLVIGITYYDTTGKHYYEIVEGFTAVIMQHEFDHLNGILFIDQIREQQHQNYELLADRIELLINEGCAKRM